MKTDEYQCELCNKTYKKGWTDEEAIKESQEIFGEYSQEDLAVICDDCWQKL